MGKVSSSRTDDSIESRVGGVVASFRDAKLVHSAGETAKDALCGGAIFFGGVSLTQLSMLLCRMSASTPAFPSIVGGIGVAASSILVGAFCLRRTDPTPVQMTAAAATGLLLFRLLGGRFRSLAPSDFRHPGAFGHANISLPATLEYADGNARAVIQSFGRLYGCHTCGVRSAKFHADHQPPVMVAKAENERLWNRLIAGPVVQRYYPQCDGCSNIQGAQVKKNAQKLKLHLWALRGYHATGFWMVLFGAGGLGGYIAQSPEADSSIVEQVAAHATDVWQPPTLARLREREAALKLERLAADTLRKKAIDIELAHIRERKATLKLAAKVAATNA
ncbi:hypothetical protein, variant [Aphanomyces astaci]|uniref:Uncharacterized protein n=1 Tax=Aphanomyces astaci TaxID=112090 RepID=W4HCU3_APHAT|nr:hypothetical protein H257_00386 [Aphanomyces astaci]XP_009821354.1 hypothetical protein, variant [Aphanomyces astaci]ETV88953.1 hypothetical protein H257_00386 [Aphanomyces astaci]ETV88954.1 hypothetical protein, variant [Aphanomyces astaci]|eukprot:XP_009821353.1 hypothetical protein H257_00386 [Aphanomyces astaci]